MSFMEGGEQAYQEEAMRYLQEGYEKQSQGEVENAISLYKKSLEVCPTPEAYTFLGWAYSFQGRYEDAIQECCKAIEIDPEFGNPYNDIGAYLIEQQRLDEAVTWLEKALKAKRYESYCYPLFNLGRISELKKDWQQAMRFYTQALELSPQYTLADQAIRRLQSMMN